MSSDLDTHKPLESFFPKLATLDTVEVALRKEFNERTPAIINKLNTGQPLVDHELSAHDIITDLDQENAMGFSPSQVNLPGPVKDNFGVMRPKKNCPHKGLDIIPSRCF